MLKNVLSWKIFCHWEGNQKVIHFKFLLIVKFFHLVSLISLWNCFIFSCGKQNPITKENGEKEKLFIVLMRIKEKMRREINSLDNLISSLFQHELFLKSFIFWSFSRGMREFVNLSRANFVTIEVFTNAVESVFLFGEVSRAFSSS